MADRTVVTLVCMVAIVVTFVPVSAQTDDAATDRHRWHAPRRNARTAPRRLLYPTADDGNPLAGPMHALKDGLADVGITYDLDVAFLGQVASDVDSGDDAVASFFWELTGDWKLLPADGANDGYLAWDIFGGAGLGYEIDAESLSANVGSISTVSLSDLLDEPAIVNELFWKQRLADGKVLVLAGKIDMSYHFDTNALANNQFTQFNSFSLTNNVSIPFPTYGGWGGVVRADFSEHGYAMFGMGDSSVFSAVAPWNTSDGSSWYELLELGLTLDVPGLGPGTYRFIPWHNELLDEDGWGFGASIDQTLGPDGLHAFFRFGVADGDVSAVGTFVSGGLALHGPFGRAHDTAAVGVAWSDPSAGNGVREETMIEAYYQLQLSPSVLVAPSIQVVLDPALSTDGGSSVIAGLRMTMRF